MNEIVNFLFSPAVANDFPYAFRESVKAGFDFPQVWSRMGSGMGEYRVLTLWAWPVDFLYGLGGLVGINFSILEKFLGMVPIFVVGTWSILKFLEYYKVKNLGKWAGAFLYLMNTYILLIVDGGQFVIGLAYAFMPVAFLSFVRSTEGGWKQKVLSGLSVSLLGFFDVRFVYVLAILLFLHFIYKILFSQRRIYLLLKWVGAGLISTLIFFGINFYWILPGILAKMPSSPNTYTRTSQTSFLNFTQLKHSVSLLQPHWYENVFGIIPPFRKEFLLIPILVFLAPALKRKNKEVWFWTVVAVISVFLTKGASSPFSGIYPWLFTHVPGFSLFRDSTKFFFLVALSYSVLIAFTVDEITKRLPKYKVVFPLLLILYLLFLIRPVYLGKMTGTFSEPRYKNEYFSLADKLEEDKNFGRIFWIPSKAPLGFSSPTHPTVEASRLESLRPFAVATVGSFETQNFIREGNYMGELFDIAGIRYIAYPYFDPKRDDMSKEKVDYYNTFINQIGNLPWVGEKISDIPIPVFKTKENKDKFFLAENTYFVVGSDRIYQDIVKIGAKFSDNALIFAEENPGLIKRIDEFPSSKIILYGKNQEDLITSFLDGKDFIFPAKNLDFSPSAGPGSSGWPASNALRSNAGWWKRETVDLVWWRDFLQQKYGIDNSDFDYGGGWAIAEGGQELQISNDKLQIGNILLARVMESSRGGKVEFYQGDTLIGKIDTKIEKPEKVKIKLSGYKEIPDSFFEYDKADFYWFEVGKLISGNPFTIKTEGDINIVNALASVQKDEWKSIDGSIHRYKIYDWQKMSAQEKAGLLTLQDETRISYQRIAPTHYRVKVEGVKRPVTLAFSETYDSLWQISPEEPKGFSYPLYSLINGFYIDGDGEYDVYFTPQRYVIPGLIVSGLTLASVLALLFLV